MKILLLTFNEQEEEAIDKIITTMANYAQFETVHLTPIPVLSFPGLEIRQHQRRVLQNGEEINLTRLEYSTLIFLASNPCIIKFLNYIVCKHFIFSFPFFFGCCKACPYL